MTNTSIAAIALPPIIINFILGFIFIVEIPILVVLKATLHKMPSGKNYLETFLTFEIEKLSKPSSKIKLITLE